MKNVRLRAMVKAFREGATELNSSFKGKSQVILIEGVRRLILLSGLVVIYYGLSAQQKIGPRIVW